MSISSQQSTAMEQPEGESLQSHELTVMVDQLIHDLQYSISRVSTDLTTKSELGRHVDEIKRPRTNATPITRRRMKDNRYRSRRSLDFYTYNTQEMSQHTQPQSHMHLPPSTLVMVY
ncbi:hypothetical protein G7K_0104-t1 [Saitoella complicata NRRL Y-17804]|uniref:Uncharacterized protein n=1 Tax=Saitoella complicata (strain BCRC 22490 / CBS 7301 / JCM 7358 / NBRC 10748 / NRRL Y-17804) TaxID=698492 RepID=A0A0E9N809_SAICN|nr:hypothetical protein G7K_0104-t1 [Saitoella complicata NRRL Y-17804]